MGRWLFIVGPFLSLLIPIAAVAFFINAAKLLWVDEEDT